MVTVQLPYGSESLSIDIPPGCLKGIFTPRPVPPCQDLQAELEQGVALPLREQLAARRLDSGAKALILVDDQTRVTSAGLILPTILRELNHAGISDGQVTILITHGTHRPATGEEIRRKIGEDAIRRCRIFQHDCQVQDYQVFVGLTSLGTPVWVNRLAVEADFRVGIGHIGPSPFVGYSGGGKMILPGIASLDTINANHSFVPLSYRRFGRTDNPGRVDIEEAARLVGLDFLVNVVHCQDGTPARIFAGSMEDAFREGLAFARPLFEVSHPGLADIAITSAYPYDYDLYQAVRAIEFGDAAVKPGGAILVAAACPQGTGSEEFFQLLADPQSSPEFFLRKITRREGKVTFNVIGYFLARIRLEKRVFLKSDGIDPQRIKKIGLIPTDSLQRTLNLLLAEMGPDASVSVFPAGSTTIPLPL